jgi:cytochrome c-type biogenesis protein CcmH
MMVERLALRLAQNPDDAEGWAMLARSYNVLGRYQDASLAYGKAVARIPGNASLLADYADALAMARGRRLQGEPEALIQRALAANPKHIKSLALAGSVAFEKRDYAGALSYWERITQLVPPDSDVARSIGGSIKEARTLAGAPAAPVMAAASQPAADAARGVSGIVQLAPALAGKVAPDDTVFIFARAAEGPRMPLAVLRKKASELPITFTLDDSLAMTPQARLSGVPQIIVGLVIFRA